MPLISRRRARVSGLIMSSGSEFVGVSVGGTVNVRKDGRVTVALLQEPSQDSPETFSPAGVLTVSLSQIGLGQLDGVTPLKWPLNFEKLPHGTARTALWSYCTSSTLQY